MLHALIQDHIQSTMVKDSLHGCVCTAGLLMIQLEAAGVEQRLLLLAATHSSLATTRQLLYSSEADMLSEWVGLFCSISYQDHQLQLKRYAIFRRIQRHGPEISQGPSMLSSISLESRTVLEKFLDLLAQQRAKAPSRCDNSSSAISDILRPRTMVDPHA